MSMMSKTRWTKLFQKKEAAFMKKINKHLTTTQKSKQNAGSNNNNDWMNSFVVDDGSIKEEASEDKGSEDNILLNILVCFDAVVVRMLWPLFVWMMEAHKPGSKNIIPS